LQHGNRGIAPAKRKIVAWQSKDCASQKKNRSATIDGSRWPREKLQCGNQGIALASSKKKRRGNWGIVPASAKIAAWQSKDRAQKLRHGN
jgi:hypothetical protein